MCVCVCLCVCRFVGNSLARLITPQPPQSGKVSTFQGHDRPGDREEDVGDEGESQRIDWSDTHRSLVSSISDFSVTAGLYSHLNKIQFRTLEPGGAGDERLEEDDLGVSRST